MKRPKSKRAARSKPNEQPATIAAPTGPTADEWIAFGEIVNNWWNGAALFRPESPRALLDAIDPRHPVTDDAQPFAPGHLLHVPTLGRRPSRKQRWQHSFFEAARMPKRRCRPPAVGRHPLGKRRVPAAK